MRWLTFLCLLVFLTLTETGSSQIPATLGDGQVIDLDGIIPSNERGIVCLAEGDKGIIFGGTSGRAAHLFQYSGLAHEAKSLARLEGGIGLAHNLIVLPDGSLISGTQADPTGTAVSSDVKAVGKLMRFTLTAGVAKTEELGIPVAGQGIYALAHVPESQQIVGNTWPDGHFFSYDLKAGKFKDHGAIAGYRTFQTPKHAKDLNQGSKDNVIYPRQVSRALVVVPGVGVLTAGKDGFLYHYDPAKQTLKKLTQRPPAVPGREPWASLDQAVCFPKKDAESGFDVVIGGTSDGYLFELRVTDAKTMDMRPRGRAFGSGTIQAMAMPRNQGKGQGVVGIGGPFSGLPRSFPFSHGGKTSALLPGGVPVAGGQHSMVGIGAMLGAADGTIYAGERDRIGRLLRYHLDKVPTKKVRKQRSLPAVLGDYVFLDNLPKLEGWVCFAPEGTTTDGSGYTAINVGLDGQVYVGAARYGGYAYLLRFDPERRTYFMEKVVDLRELTGERLEGINTQGKIHAIIIVGPDGKIWFATKQAHEVFGTRPEYGEDDNGFPGGHLCYFDPKTGFARSMGILKKQEGLMGGTMDKKQNMLYYRSEPKNYFLSYNVSTGQVQDRGHVGANCRYMAIDKDGAVYSPARGDYLSRFDPKTNYLEDLAIRMENDGPYAAPYVIQTGPNGKLYGAGGGLPWIIEFDIDTCKKGLFGSVTARNVAPAAPPGYPVHDIHAAIFGKDGKFYYPLVTSEVDNKKGRKGRFLVIMRFDPQTKKTEAVGVPHLPVDEAKVKHAYNRGDKYSFDHIQGMAVGVDGTLCVMDIYPQLNVAVFPRLTAPKK